MTEPFAPALAVYVAKNRRACALETRGKAAFPEIISQQTTDPEFYFKVVTVRGKKVAAACAAQPYKAEALDFLVLTMERAIEVFGLRLRAPMLKPEVAPQANAGSAARESSGSHCAAGANSSAPVRTGTYYLRRPVLRRPLPQQRPQMNPPVHSTF